MWTKILLPSLLLLLIFPASANPLVKVEITNTTSGYYESLTVQKPENDRNWIKLTGGSDVITPSVKLVYNGINSTQYTKGDKTVKITTYGILDSQDYVVNYPFTKHPVYYQDDSVTAEITVTSDLAGETAYVYLVKTYPTELKNSLSSAVDGNTQPLRNLLNSYVQNKTVNLSSGYATVSFGTLSPGDYVVVATLNTSSDANMTLISATTLEVLEYKSTIDVGDVERSSVSDTVFLEGKFTVSGGSSDAYYTYLAALVRNDAYSVEIKLESNGSKETTDLKANGAVLVESFKVGGVGLSNVNATTVYDWIRDAFPSNSASLAKEKIKGNMYEFSLPVKGLQDGDYYLNIASWDSTNSSQRVVAFSQAVVKITTVTPTPTPAPVYVSGAGAAAPPPALEVPSGVTYEIAATIPANVERTFEMPSGIKDATDIMSISIESSERITPRLTVSEIDQLPERVPNPPGDVYVAFEVIITYTSMYDVKLKSYNNFRVSKDWLEVEDHVSSDIVLMKYDGEWIELETEEVGEDENYYYYRAEAESFSIFAITTKPKVVATPTPTATPVITPTVTPTAVPIETPVMVTPTPKPWWRIPGFEVVLAIAALAAALALRRKRE